MKEYRVMAYFKDNAPRGYEPRSYKRKIVNTYREAKILKKQAKRYYSTYNYLKKIVIESREVTEWERVKCNLKII